MRSIGKRITRVFGKRITSIAGPTALQELNERKPGVHNVNDPRITRIPRGDGSPSGGLTADYKVEVTCAELAAQVRM